MRKGKLFISFLTLFLFFGCIKEDPLVEPERYPNTPKGNFQAFWDGMNRRYAFWEYDPTDWDAIYEKYEKQVTDETSPSELADIFKEMVETLIDCHYKILVQIDTLEFEIYPGKVNENLEKYHFLLDKAYFEGKLFNRLAPGTRKKYKGFVYGVLNNKYQYIHLPEFDIFNVAGENPQFVVDLFEFMANPGPEIKGVILDLRANTGGNPDEISLIVGNFTDKELVVGESKTKYGSNRNEFTPWVPVKVVPNPESKNRLPMVVLCDGFSVSSAERTTMALSLLPQVTVVGERTFGAQSAIYPNKVGRNLQYAGSFSLPNGWLVVSAFEVYRFADGQLYEGVGFPPDVVVPLDVARFKATGFDNQLEKALEILPK
ncbi:MAG: S41 family peptidase [Saprospiraceae bacterium]|nr:S41 family peptidase [Saprospiraceae bacterium]MDW8484534.1 S41 family peptidase [Saprospiraceae bacterium]